MRQAILLTNRWLISAEQSLSLFEISSCPKATLLETDFWNDSRAIDILDIVVQSVICKLTLDAEFSLQPQGVGSFMLAKAEGDK